MTIYWLLQRNQGGCMPKKTKMRIMNNNEAKPKPEINFEILESITVNQRDISNWLLLYCAKEVVRNSDAENKERRRKQFNDSKKNIMPDFESSDDFKKITTKWWDDELKWFKKQSKDFKNEILINALSYRLQSLFFKNHNRCCFYEETKKGRKPDIKDFNLQNQKIFERFLNQSIQIISSERKYKLITRFFPFIRKKYNPIMDILPFVKEMKEMDITKKITSATHKLLGKDWRIAKGLVLGGGTGLITSIFLSPVIGGLIGNLAGLYGAAATSYGLALLGGGSLASGGFGMLGGSVVLGLGFGISNGVREGVKGASIDTLNQMQAETFLSLLLAIGQFQFENGDDEIPKLIHKTISRRLQELEERLKTLKKKNSKIIDEKDTKNVETAINTVKRSIALYERAEEMSLDYDWLSGYDIYKGVKKWVS